MKLDCYHNRDLQKIFESVYPPEYAFYRINEGPWTPFLKRVKRSAK